MRLSHGLLEEAPVPFVIVERVAVNMLRLCTHLYRKSSTSSAPLDPLLRESMRAGLSLVACASLSRAFAGADGSVSSGSDSARNSLDLGVSTGEQQQQSAYFVTPDQRAPAGRLVTVLRELVAVMCLSDGW